LLSALPAAAQLVTITGSHVGAGAQPAGASWTACLTPTGIPGKGFHVGSTGQAVGSPVCRDVVNGVILNTLNGVSVGAMQVPDGSLSAPSNPCQNFTVRDDSGSYVIGTASGQFSGYGCVQPAASNSFCSAGVCNLDNYIPNIAPVPFGVSVAQLSVGSLVITGTCTGCSNAAVYWGNILGTLSHQTDLQTALNLKANDSAVLHNTDNESVGGVKAFSSSPTVPDPTNATDAANKEYVLANAGGSSPSNATPNMDSGSGSAGSSAAYSRGDHTHPVDTSRQAALGFTPENLAHKNAANGYAPLDANTLLPAANAPAGTLGEICIGQGPGTPCVYADPLVQGTQADGSGTEPNPVMGGVWDGTHLHAPLADSSGRQVVNVNSSGLPTGAATSAKQPALGTAGSASADVISVQGEASMTPLKVDGSGVTQPVSIASMPTTAVTIADGAGSTMGSKADAKSAATDATPTSIVSLLKELSSLLQGSLAVTGSFYQTTQPVSLASAPLPTGAATSAKQPAIGTAGSASADVISVQGEASMTPLKVDGSGVTQPVSIASMPTTAVTIADGAGSTMGSKTDAKSTATDSTSVSIVSLLKEISAMLQSPASTAVTSTPLTDLDAAIQAPGSAAPSKAVQVGGTDGTNTIVPFIDPCQRGAKTFIAISLTATTKLVSGVSAKKIYICSINLIAAAATNVALVEGTKVTTECDTSTAGIKGLSGGATAATGWNLAANGGIAFGNGGFSIGAEATNADDLCVFVSAANQISGGLSYVAY
jgi:hypothetical protein